MSIPAVPPRPMRAQNGPIRKTDPSPDREAYVRSPLNALPGFRPPPQPLGNSSDAPRRPPSISLPSDAGQEGFEYSSYDQLPQEAHGVESAGETQVAADVPMIHAPKASIPASTAKRNIAMVTRTEASPASSEFGVHKYPSEAQSPLARVTSRDENGLRRAPSTEPHPLRSRTSFSRSGTSLPGTSRPASIHGDETGIPLFGRHIPLYPNAGDVQAPSPDLAQSQHAPGIGFFNDGSSRAHHRKRSSRHEFGPPDSYGLHGHGMEPQDQFEREWIAKHPSEAAKESSSSHLPRPETALTSEQLNRLVLMNEDIGMGTNRDMVGTPSQEIAFDATDKYTQRLISPRPTSAAQQGPPSGAQLTVESPLRKSTFSPQETGLADHGHGIIHVDETNRPVGKMQPEEHEIERSRTPILADDEVLKRPGSAYMHPAVSAESHYDDYYDSDHYHGSNSRRSSLPPSRPSSRPSSVHGQPQHATYHGGHLHRYVSHEEHHSSGVGTPLAEIEEYEPLFPNDDKFKPRALKKRPSLTHHFPSQDIWEDTPSSLQYQAEVATPELDGSMEGNADAQGDSAKVFETPAQEARRKSTNDADMLSADKTFAKPHFKPGVRREQRPGVARFPSQDIWEDTPDSMRLETTVNSPQMDDVLSPPEDRPTTAALPLRQDDPHARSTTSGGTQVPQPRIPERPQRRSKLAQEITDDTPAEHEQALADEVSDLGVSDRTRGPAIPDRPKPSVPARPARTSQSSQGDGAALSPTTSHGSEGSSTTITSPPVVKPKPVVPARPVGGKIAALQAGFMNDLNNRLQLGPRGPPSKPKETEVDSTDEEKAPLQDARKSRARGPPRRKPASAADSGGFSFSFCSPMTLWQIDETDEISVSTAPSVEPIASVPAAAKTAAPVSSVGAEGDLPDPSITDATLERHEAVHEDLQDSLAQDGVPEDTPASVAKDEPSEVVPASAEAAPEPLPEETPAVETAETKHVV